MRNDLAVACGNSSAELAEVIQALMLGRASVAQVLELVYWAQEPGVLELTRSFLELSKDDRALAAAFLARAESKHLSAAIDDSGALVFKSNANSDIAQTFLQAQVTSKYDREPRRAAGRGQ